MKVDVISAHPDQLEADLAAILDLDRPARSPLARLAATPRRSGLIGLGVVAVAASGAAFVLLRTPATPDARQIAAATAPAPVIAESPQISVEKPAEIREERVAASAPAVSEVEPAPRPIDRSASAPPSLARPRAQLASTGRAAGTRTLVRERIASRPAAPVERPPERVATVDLLDRAPAPEVARPAPAAPPPAQQLALAAPSSRPAATDRARQSEVPVKEAVDTKQAKRDQRSLDVIRLLRRQ